MTFTVQLVSPCGVRHDLYCGLTELEANDICQRNHWQYFDENDVEWLLDYVEDCESDEDDEEDEEYEVDEIYGGYEFDELHDFDADSYDLDKDDFWLSSTLCYKDLSSRKLADLEPIV